MRRLGVWLVMGLLGSAILGARTLNDRSPRPPIAAPDMLLPMGLIQVAEQKLQALGFDPGPVDGVFTEQTAETVRQYQRRYGLVVSGLLDSATRRELIPGLEKPPGDGGG